MSVGVILAISGDDGAETTALAAGANGFLPKPLTSIADFQEAILSHLPADRQPAGPRRLNEDHVRPDRVAYRDDMAFVADMLNDDHDGAVLDYVAQFLGGVARSADDAQLVEAAQLLAESRRQNAPTRADVARLAGLIQNRLTERAAM